MQHFTHLTRICLSPGVLLSGATVFAAHSVLACKGVAGQNREALCAEAAPAAVKAKAARSGADGEQLANDLKTMLPKLYPPKGDAVSNLRTEMATCCAR